MTMDPKLDTDRESSVDKDTLVLRTIFEILVFFVLVPTVMYGYPSGTYPSVADWWDKGQAQLSIESARSAVANCQPPRHRVCILSQSLVRPSATTSCAVTSEFG